MKILLVGDGNSQFIQDFSKWLKIASNNTIQIDVFSILEISEITDTSNYDHFTATTYNTLSISKLKFIGHQLWDIYLNRELINYLKHKGFSYDIINFHWIRSAWIINTKEYKKYCKYIVTVFWGAEWRLNKLFFSNQIYRIKLKKLLAVSDKIILDTTDMENEIIKLGTDKSKLAYATLGSTPLAKLEEIMGSISCENSKIELGLDPTRISVIIGYSGKPLHNHLEIIRTLNASFKNNQEIINKVELVVPMTYGCNARYQDTVEFELEKSSFKYKVFRQDMDEDKVAKFRIATDIFLQLSSSDARSLCVVENFIASNIIISASWLPYFDFKNEGLFFYEVDSIAEMPQLLNKVIAEFSETQKLFLNNKCLLNGKQKWDNVIGKWVQIFEDLMKN